MTDFRKMTDDELAQAADAGLRGSGAIIEMQRRLRDSNTHLAWVNTALALVGVSLAIVQILIAIIALRHAPSAPIKQ